MKISSYLESHWKSPFFFFTLHSEAAGWGENCRKVQWNREWFFIIAGLAMLWQNNSWRKRDFFWLWYSQTSAKFYCVKILRKRKTTLSKIYAINNNNLLLENLFYAKYLLGHFSYLEAKHACSIPYLNKFSIGYFYLTSLAQHGFMVAL